MGALSGDETSQEGIPATVQWRVSMCVEWTA